MIQVMGDPSGIFGALLAALFFLLCYKVDIKVTSIRALITCISLSSLDMYLCCYLFDAVLYPIFKEAFHWQDADTADYYFALIVPTLFVGSLVAAQFRRYGCKGLIFAANSSKR